MIFPLYRKYPNDTSIFKITSAEAFEELKRTANRWALHEFQAKIHPDRVFIQDMMEMNSAFWVESSEAEWLMAMAKSH